MERNGFLHCPLCGMEFRRADTACAHGCPLGTDCNLVRCPSCSYEFPPPFKGTSPLRRLLDRLRFGKSDRRDTAFTLDRLRSGERARLRELTCSADGRRNTLTVFGLVPGTDVTLIQRRPTYVVRVGETELGLDAEIAREIVVEPL